MNSSLEAVVSRALAALEASLAQLVILLGPGLLLGFVLSVLSGQLSKSIQRVVGFRLSLALFGALGTSVHEIGHAMFHVIFRHKIHDMKLYDPTPNADGTYTLGYVMYSYNSRSPYQQIGRFFASVGPLILGSVVIFLAAAILAPEGLFRTFAGLNISFETIKSVDSSAPLLRNIIHAVRALLLNLAAPENYRSWKFYVFIYILFCVGSHMSLSRPDLNGAIYGLLTLFGILFALNFAAAFFGGMPESYFEAAAKYYSVFYAVMISAIAMNLIMLIPVKLMYFAKTGRIL